MGWTGIDDFVTKTGAGKLLRTDWQKLYTQVAATAGYWYDLSLGGGNPTQFGWNATAPNIGGYGEMIKNGGFVAGSNYWTLDTGWVWSANTMQKQSVGVVRNLVSAGMQKNPVAGRTYRVTWTISSWTSGGATCWIGGTASGGGVRASAATFVETIVATNGTALTFVPNLATAVFTISCISVVEVLQAFPMDDTLQGSFYHGGNVSPATKHLINVGCMTNSLTTAPSTLILVDLLMCYSGISHTVVTPSLQTFANVAALPRYSDGVGVKAFLVTSVSAGANASNVYLRYTNTTGDNTRNLSQGPNIPTLSTAQRLPTSGVLANNYGPFLPLQVGDLGLTNAVSITFQTSMTSGESCLVLCKPLATIPIANTLADMERDFFNQLPSLPRIYDGACLGLLCCAGAAIPATGVFTGFLDFAWG